MKRFIGNIDAKLDTKGRVFVPAAFRKILNESGEEHFILRQDIHQKCLVLYPEAAWSLELDELRKKLNRWDEMQQTLYRQLVKDTERVETDSNGRILIPKKYLQWAEISGEVRFVGMDYTIEIWNREKIEKPLMDPDEFRENIRKYLGNDHE